VFFLVFLRAPSWIKMLSPESCRLLYRSLQNQQRDVIELWRGSGEAVYFIEDQINHRLR
jgi:hypothetical protein